MQAEILTTAAGMPLQGPLLLTPRVFGDDRGFFFESWNQQAFTAACQAQGQVAPGFVQLKSSSGHMWLSSRASPRATWCGSQKV